MTFHSVLLVVSHTSAFHSTHHFLQYLHIKPVNVIFQPRKSGGGGVAEDDLHRSQGEISRGGRGAKLEKITLCTSCDKANQHTVNHFTHGTAWWDIFRGQTWKQNPFKRAETFRNCMSRDAWLRENNQRNGDMWTMAAKIRCERPIWHTCYCFKGIFGLKFKFCFGSERANPNPKNPKTNKVTGERLSLQLLSIQPWT